MSITFCEVFTLFEMLVLRKELTKHKAVVCLYFDTVLHFLKFFSSNVWLYLTLKLYALLFQLSAIKSLRHTLDNKQIKLTLKGRRAHNNLCQDKINVCGFTTKVVLSS